MRTPPGLSFGNAPQWGASERAGPGATVFRTSDRPIRFAAVPSRSAARRLQHFCGQLASMQPAREPRNIEQRRPLRAAALGLTRLSQTLLRLQTPSILQRNGGAANGPARYASAQKLRCFNPD